MDYKNPVNLLMVGDDRFVDDVVAALEGSHVNVLAAGSPLAAMKTIASQRFHAIVCDGGFGMPAVEFVVSLRAAGFDTPVILLTGNENALTDDETLQDQGVEILPQALVTPELLWRTIRYAIATAGRKQILRSVLDATDAGIVLVNEDGLPSVWNPAFAELAHILIGSGPETVEQFAEYAIHYDQPELCSETGPSSARCHICRTA